MDDEPPENPAFVDVGITVRAAYPPVDASTSIEHPTPPLGISLGFTPLFYERDADVRAMRVGLAMEMVHERFLEQPTLYLRTAIDVAYRLGADQLVDYAWSSGDPAITLDVGLGAAFVASSRRDFLVSPILTNQVAYHTPQGPFVAITGRLGLPTTLAFQCLGCPAIHRDAAGIGVGVVLGFETVRRVGETP